MLEGSRVVADVFECFAQGKMNVLPLAGGQVAGVGGQCFQCGQVGVARAKGLQVGEDVMGQGIARTEGQRSGAMRGGFVELAQVTQHAGQVVVRFDRVGLQRECLRELCLGLFGLTQLMEDAGEVLVDLNEMGVLRQFLLVVVNRTFEMALLPEAPARLLCAPARSGLSAMAC